MAKNPDLIPDEGKEKESTPLDKAKVAVRDNLLKKRDEMIQEVEEAFEKKISAGSSSLGEIALAQIVHIKNEQVNEIAAFFNEKIKEFQALDAESAGRSDEIASDLMKTATDKAKKRIGELKAILDAKVKNEHVTTPEVAEIEKAIKDIKEFENKHPKAEKTFDTLANKGELTKDDYEQVVDLIVPIDPSNPNMHGALEASSAGLFISMMRPDQRYELVKVFMDSPKREGTFNLIDVMMRTGKLSKMQGDKLVEEAKAKGLNPSTQIEEIMKTTDYEVASRQYQKSMEGDAQSKYGGQFADNIANRFSGKPFFYFMALCWGTVTLGMNILVNRKKGDKIGTVLDRLAHNPYVWASGIAIGAGAEGMFGAMKTSNVKTGDLMQDWGLGAGPISRGIESWSEKGDEDVLKARARVEMERIYTDAPQEFREYVERGGFVALQEVRQEILDKNLPKKITIDQLLEKEQDPDQKRRLSSMKTLTFTTEEGMNTRLTAFSEAAFVMGVEKNDDLQLELKSYREKQGPSANV